MPEADAYRRLAAALEELEIWARLAPLLPFAVHVDHDSRRLEERRRQLARIPTQRARPVDLWPVPRARRPIQLPRRMQ